MFQTNHIMAQDQINCIYITKEDCRVLFGINYVSWWITHGLKWGIPWIFLFGSSLFYYYYVFLIIKNLIMEQDQINFLHHKKEDCWVLFGITLCNLMDLLQPKTGNPLEIIFWFLSVLIILCLPAHESYKHVQSWNPTNTNYFTGRHIHNNIRDKPNKTLGKRCCGDRIPILNMFMIFMNRTT